MNKFEVQRAVRLTNNNTIEYISFSLPNKTGNFDASLYPEFASNEAVSNFMTWATGTDTPSKKMRLSPDSQSAQRRQSTMGSNNMAAYMAAKKEGASFKPATESTSDNSAELAAAK